MKISDVTKKTREQIASESAANLKMWQEEFARRVAVNGKILVPEQMVEEDQVALSLGLYGSTERIVKNYTWFSKKMTDGVFMLQTYWSFERKYSDGWKEIMASSRLETLRSEVAEDLPFMRKAEQDQKNDPSRFNRKKSATMICL